MAFFLHKDDILFFTGVSEKNPACIFFSPFIFLILHVILRWYCVILVRLSSCVILSNIPLRSLITTRLTVKVSTIYGRCQSNLLTQYTSVLITDYYLIKLFNSCDRPSV